MTRALGLIGLGTMGASLARNAARNGATVAVYNRTTEKTDAFIGAHGKEGTFVSAKTLKDLVKALPPPRAILLMVKAGEAVDATIAELLPLLSKGDMLIDAGNSHYRDTERREKALAEKGLHFVGMGVSGGERGALLGPSMMPGGSKESYNALEPLLRDMAAEDGAGGKCVAHIGPRGAGHFVKTVHNGIEYGLMQLIAETYAVLRAVGGLSLEKLGTLFTEWSSKGDLQSFLMEITAVIVQRKDEGSTAYLVDLIKDVGGQKGTGKWTTFAAMDYGVAIPSITAAVDARILSAHPEQRLQHQKEYPSEPIDVAVPTNLTSMAKSALEAATVATYLQGFDLLTAASAEEKWNLKLDEIARIWRGGCIIRSSLLPVFQQYHSADSAIAASGRDEIRKRFGEKRQEAWRTVVSLAIAKGVPVPALSASLAYYDTMRSERLPQSLIQAQRDFFGAHTYERLDKQGVFHTEWQP